MAPQPIGREERNVGSVANSVVGIAENALPRRFRPTLASAADDAAGRRRPGGAPAGAAAAGHGSFEEGTE